MRRSLLLSAAFFTVAAINAHSAPLTGSAAFTDWTADAPGVQRMITPRDLQQPRRGGDDAATNRSKIVPRPADMMPKVPKGFQVKLIASGLNKPRVLRLAPNGDVFVAESDGGRILILRANEIGDPAKAPHVFAEGLTRPYGIAFYPAGPAPSFVYVGEPGRVIRYRYKSGDMAATGPAQPIVSNIPA